MPQQFRVPAVYMRGGTSRGVFFHSRDLPDSREAWDAIFMAVLGTPDPYQRQLNGLGGGISSLSKAVVIGPPTHPEADVDYTFAQVAVESPGVFYTSMCGNLTGAVGPFAVDEGLLRPAGNEALVRIHNTNTKKIIWARFPLVDGEAAVDGDFALAGVAGTHARVRLEFRHPAGAITGKLLPTGNLVDRIDVPGLGAVEASLVDSTNPCVFVRASALGLNGTELPDAIEADRTLLERLAAIRNRAGVMMGIGKTPEEMAKAYRATPLVAVVAEPGPYTTLSGEAIPAEAGDVQVRMISMGRPHRALPASGTMCAAVASRIEGTLVHAVSRRPASPEDDVRVMHPSGVSTLAATVRRAGGRWDVEQVVTYRSARRIMEGAVLVPYSLVKAAISLPEPRRAQGR